MPSLRYVDIGINHLKGNLQEEMCRQLPLLEVFGVEYNQLEGSIPKSISNCTSLKEIYLDGNSFTGFVPKGIGKLDKLNFLDFSYNHLKGPIPSNIFNISTWRTLNLAGNSLSGVLPSNLGIGLPNLKDLRLQVNGLTGQIPSSISNASKLITLRLSSNKFNGAIPNVLGNLTNLMELDLGENHLSGLIPDTVNKLHSLQLLSLSNNRLQGFIINELCQLKSLTIVILKNKRDDDNNSTERDLTALDTPIRISYFELLRGTNGFSESNLVGFGSFGSIYKAILPNEKIVAVKVLNLDIEEASRSFDVECSAMCHLRHRNLIKIISSCSNGHFKSLIMEFMVNGSLDRWLYSHNYYLNVLQRLNIMIDVAAALEYLHHGSSTVVVHCDVKPSNVLLDEDMVTHLGDFGIAKLFGEKQLEIYTETLATIGYIAPEFGSKGVVSTKGDVYSYGILLMEIFTRKKPTDEMFVQGLSLKDWVSNSTPHSIMNIIDVNLLREKIKIR
ncbi:hypothetical protein K1719_043849 [Acacia pycnantha]|nr:hypothetical protein K1719_043849 [Acacia pycnantha]